MYWNCVWVDWEVIERRRNVGSYRIQIFEQVVNEEEICIDIPTFLNDVPHVRINLHL